MSIKNPIFTKKNIMFALLKFGAIFYSIVTLGMFFTYGFWWTISILFTSSMVLFGGFVAQIPYIRRWYLAIIVATYVIITYTAKYWGIQDPDVYVNLTYLFIPAGYVLLGDFVIDSLRELAEAIFGD